MTPSKYESPCKNKLGEIITKAEWMKLQCDESYVSVKHEEFFDGSYVSTAWIGTGGILFESGHFDRDNADLNIVFSLTEDTALVAHEELAVPLRSRDAAAVQYGADSGVQSLGDGAL